MNFRAGSFNPSYVAFRETDMKFVLLRGVLSGFPAFNDAGQIFDFTISFSICFISYFDPTSGYIEVDVVVFALKAEWSCRLQHNRLSISGGCEWTQHIFQPV